MIEVTFYSLDSGALSGFSSLGHANAGDAGNDIVCAAVSSAVYMAANTVTDVLGIDAQVRCDEAYLSLRINADDTEKAQGILGGLLLHIEQLQQQYPKNVSVQKRRCN
ncbi:MAG: ribosomal-processing cysteine protease Prp [Clostridiales bacterium]|nr:ribosomal-processing cysteine protease Prp [Clostridiales bacterium]